MDCEKSILDGLSESQKKVVTTTEGPLMVIAGPGAGKTLTIVIGMTRARDEIVLNG